MRPRKPSRLWIIFVGVVAALGSVGLFIYLSVGSSARSVRADIKAIQRLGAPATYQELAKLEPSRGTDAAPLYDTFSKARLTLGQAKAVDVLFPANRTSYALAQRVAAANVLRPAIKPLLVGAGMDRCSFAINSPGNADDHVIAARLDGLDRGVRYIAAIASADIESGHRDEGLAELKACEKISAQLSRVPSLSVALLAEGIDGVVRVACKRLALNHPRDLGLLQELTGVLIRTSPLEDPRMLYLSLFVEDVWKFDNDSRQSFWSEHLNDSADDLAAAIRRQHLVAENFAMWREEFDSLPKEAWTWKQADKAFRDVASRHPNFELRDFGQSGASNVADSFLVGQARTELAVLGDQVMIAAAKTGGLPDSLPNGFQFKDPFSGKPYGYKKTPNGFLVYCVGLDRQDDGGKTSRETTDGHFDIVEFFESPVNA